MPNNYFQQIDLNPAVGGPINNPMDIRAMHYFGFLSQGQQLQLLDGLPAGNTVLFSFDYASPPLIGPLPPFPQVDGALDFFGGASNVMRFDTHHDRAHVLVWLDGPALPAGQQCRVRISAWAQT